MSNQKVKIKKAGLMVLFFQMLFLVGFLLLPNVGQAAEDQQSGGITFKAQVPIGTYEGEPITGYSIGKYINALYKYAIGTVGILAATVIMWSGFMWIMAGGNPQKITEAKTWLTGALSGLVLAMTCALILNTINPELIKIRSIVPEPIKKTDVVSEKCCHPTLGIREKQTHPKSTEKTSICFPPASKAFNPTKKTCIKEEGVDHYILIEIGCCLYSQTALSANEPKDKKEYDDCKIVTKKNCYGQNDEYKEENNFQAGKKCYDKGPVYDDIWVCQ